MSVQIVAEIGCNHCGDEGIALRMIRTAASCGADWVKFQKRNTQLLSKPQRNRLYRSEHSFGYTYGDHRDALEFTKEQFVNLKKHAEYCNIGLFATPFDVDSLEILLDIGVKVIKLGSTQVHDPEMIKYCQVNLPEDITLVVSTGMMSMDQVEDLYNRLTPQVLMQTTSCYPCKEENVHLNVLHDYQVLAEQVGLSGHYVSGNGAIEAAAVALGANWIERHFTLDRTWKGTDQAASLEPMGLLNVVKAVRTVEQAMGKGVKKKQECEKATWEKIKM